MRRMNNMTGCASHRQLLTNMASAAQACGCIFVHDGANDGGLGTLKFTVNSPCVPLLLFWSALNAAGIAPKHSDRHKIVFACAYKFERLLSHRSHGQLGTVNRSSSMTPTALRAVPGPHGQLGTVKGSGVHLKFKGLVLHVMAITLLVGSALVVSCFPMEVRKFAQVPARALVC